ncbi:DUF3470 domain-containing protein, partial [Rhodovulum sulfidophilum]
VEFNRKYAEIWPVITAAGEPPANADEMDGIPNKLQTHFSPEPGQKEAS